MSDSNTSANLVCSSCPNFKIVASGAVAQTMTTKKLIEIASKIGWLTEFEPARDVSEPLKIKHMFCPQCVLDQSKKEK